MIAMLPPDTEIKMDELEWDEPTIHPYEDLNV